MRPLFCLLFFTLVFISCDEKVQKAETTDSNDLVKDFKSSADFTPLTFIREAKKTGSGQSLNVITIKDDFPKNWIKPEHIDSLMTLIDSEAKCKCYSNPLSSTIPADSADAGGFAIEFIKAFRKNEQLNLGLYNCPKTNKKEVEEIKQWWKEYKIKEKRSQNIMDQLLNLVQQQKIVRDKIRLIDSVSNGERHVTLVPVLKDPAKNIYLVKVGEDNGTNLVTYFNFLVDTNTMKIINPTGKLDE